MGRPKKNPSMPVMPSGKKIHSLENFSDILCETDLLWDLVFKKFGKMVRTYGFVRAETPILEDAQLYVNFYNAAPKIMSKVIVRQIPQGMAALRPAILPSVLRAYGEGKIYEKSPICKWFYHGPVFSQSEDQKTASQSEEFGLEIFGQFTHLHEAQSIAAVWDMYQSLGLQDLVLEINHLGESACEENYKGALLEYFSEKKFQLCDECSEHLSGRTLNIFRCANLDCQALCAEAPTALDFLDEKSHKHFTNILEALDEVGVPYQLSPLLAAPDGHSRTALAIRCKVAGKTITLAEGGYHDELLKRAANKNFCAFGLFGSMTVLHEALILGKAEVEKRVGGEVFLVPLGELAAKKSLKLFRDLTHAKILVFDHFGELGVKNQLKLAQESKAPIALIIGQKEAMDDVVILRDVKSGMQEVISYDKIVEEVKKRLGK